MTSTISENVDYRLRTWMDPILRTPCERVEDFSNLNPLIQSMFDVMRRHGGCGIAAPQVGDSRRVVIAKIGGAPQVFANPGIESARGYIPFIEGCLSFPGVIVPTIRRFSIDVNYQTFYGDEKSERFRGFDAIVLQHEIDHLNGKLMFNYFG